MPKGLHLISGVCKGFYAGEGAVCEARIAGEIVKVEVTSVAMSNMDMIEHGIIGLVITAVPYAALPLVGYTLKFPEPEPLAAGKGRRILAGCTFGAV